MTNGYIGYIQIAGFRKNTPDQFLDQLGSLTANGAKSLIIDLRGNEGGLISALEECADPLLPEGIIATADYKDGHTETIVYSDDNKLDLPLIVLVDKDTVSTAELFAAALRDFSHAQIVGIKTRGNGTIQETEKMDDGGAIVLTVAKCRTAVSESYNGVGIVPDVIVENPAGGEGDPQFDAAVELAMTSR
jgi:carboxyl-terminal processing protease